MACSTIYSTKTTYLANAVFKFLLKKCIIWMGVLTIPGCWLIKFRYIHQSCLFCTLIEFTSSQDWQVPQYLPAPFHNHFKMIEDQSACHSLGICNTLMTFSPQSSNSRWTSLHSVWTVCPRFLAKMFISPDRWKSSIRCFKSGSGRPQTYRPNMVPQASQFGPWHTSEPTPLSKATSLLPKLQS